MAVIDPRLVESHAHVVLLRVLLVEILRRLPLDLDLLESLELELESLELELELLELLCFL